MKRKLEEEGVENSEIKKTKFEVSNPFPFLTIDVLKAYSLPSKKKKNLKKIQKPSVLEKN